MQFGADMIGTYLSLCNRVPNLVQTG